MNVYSIFAVRRKLIVLDLLAIGEQKENGNGEELIRLSLKSYVFLRVRPSGKTEINTTR